MSYKPHRQKTLKCGSEKNIYVWRSLLILSLKLDMLWAGETAYFWSAFRGMEVRRKRKLKIEINCNTKKQNPDRGHQLPVFRTRAWRLQEEKLLRPAPKNKNEVVSGGKGTAKQTPTTGQWLQSRCCYRIVDRKPIRKGVPEAQPYRWLHYSSARWIRVLHSRRWVGVKKQLARNTSEHFEQRERTVGTGNTSNWAETRQWMN